MTTDERYMARCLSLARCGAIGAAPNPMVGAVIVWRDQIIGEGFHRRCGEAHAEVNAFASCRHPELLPESTLYVSLEPCAHVGRTPPCAELIIREGVKRVVVGCVDSFEKVQGRGIAMLREAGIEVTVGILENECLALNRKFFTCHRLKRPYILLKWAQSADGFMAPAEQPASPVFISTPETLIRVHHLRAANAAILVGTQTAFLDNPSLTLRYWSGQNPLRVVLDRIGKLPGTLRVFDGAVPTLVVGETDPSERAAVGTYDFLEVADWNALLLVLFTELMRRGVQSLLVEGGRKVLQSFIDEDCWDEAHVEVGTQTFGDGLMAPCLPSCVTSGSVESLFNHTVFHYFR